ncbi:MAG: DUF2071 domain-containing protein [Rubripirellula sp.]|nr:DUF2071 domain-containing protein [Rubripirellula sp.]
MPFLTATWRDLVMVNWSVPPETLEPWLPTGCKIDKFRGKTYVSLVAFLFENTRVLGISIPGHRNFEEVNLRFYVTRNTDEGEVRRGVVFIREFVPKPLIALVARLIYREPYHWLAMSHHDQRDHEGKRRIRYTWGGNWISTAIGETSQLLKPNSVEQFIAEHYWGYTKTKRGTREYRVQHPSWNWRSIDDYDSKIDFADLYGSEWGFLANQSPECIFIAEGSDVSVDPWDHITAG